MVCYSERVIKAARMKKILFLLSFSSFCLAAPSPMPMAGFDGGQKIGVQNTILTQVNGTTLSIMDVKKKMDVAFHQSYPQLADSVQARFQFYQNSWRQACLELIDHELILADAEDREIKLTDGEVREELENRFGPNVMLTLDKIGISYTEAWKMIRNEMTVQRMMWYFIHSKALQAVTPQDIRQEYRRYLKEHPPYQEWTYQIISVRADEVEKIQAAANEAYSKLIASGQTPEMIEAQLKEMAEAYPGCSVAISQEYTANHLKLSDAHKSILSQLNEGQYGKPVVQTSRADNKTIARIFYLSKKKDFPAPTFEEIAPNLKGELIQKAIAAESDRYIMKLRKHYGYDTDHLQESLPDNLNPFSIR